MIKQTIYLTTALFFILISWKVAILVRSHCLSCTPPTVTRPLPGPFGKYFPFEPWGHQHRAGPSIGAGSQFPCSPGTTRVCCKYVSTMTGEFIIGLISKGVSLTEMLKYSSSRVGMGCVRRKGDDCSQAKACCKVIKDQVPAGLSCTPFS